MRELSKEETRLTQKNLERNKTDLELLEYQQKRKLLEIEGLPLLRKQYQRELDKIRSEIKNTLMTIEHANKTLQRGNKK